ncbi:MAG TPA: hypothetical protein VF779_16630, partial [Pyrinomonadaceae bacterium]
MRVLRRTQQEWKTKAGSAKRAMPKRKRGCSLARSSARVSVLDCPRLMSGGCTCGAGARRAAFVLGAG